MAATQSERYQRWYAKNKDKLAEKRKKRYHDDPAYRQKALENRRRTLKPLPELPAQYEFNFQQAADELGVSIWRLREWRRRSYYPQPHEHGRSQYFTQAQISLLEKLRNFMNTVQGKFSDTVKDHLQDLVNLIYANWGDGDGSDN